MVIIFHDLELRDGALRIRPENKRGHLALKTSLGETVTLLSAGDWSKFLPAPASRKSILYYFRSFIDEDDCTFLAPVITHGNGSVFAKLLRRAGFVIPRVITIEEWIFPTEFTDSRLTETDRLHAAPFVEAFGLRSLEELLALGDAERAVGEDPTQNLWFCAQPDAQVPPRLEFSKAASRRSLVLCEPRRGIVCIRDVTGLGHGIGINGSTPVQLDDKASAFVREIVRVTIERIAGGFL